MTAIVTRAGKGSALSFAEVDGNFTNLNTAKVEGPGTSVDGEIALFNSTSGALLKRANITGLLKSVSGVAAAAVAGTDYLSPPSGTSLLKANSGGALANATAGTDYLAPPSGTAILKANSGGALANATANTDYLAPPGGFGILKANNGGALLTAIPGVDYVDIDGTLGTPSSGALTNCTVDGTNNIGYRNLPPVGTKTGGEYTLLIGDIGKYVQVGSGGSIRIPDGTFSEGSAVSIFNNTSVNITINCSIATAYIAGTDFPKSTMTLAAKGVATVLFISSTVCVVTGNVT